MSRPVLLGSVLFFLLAAPTRLCAEEMSLDDVVALLEMGVGEEDVLAKVRAAGTRFPLAPGDVERLKQAGASDAFIQAIRREEAPREPLTLDLIRRLLGEGTPPEEVAKRIASENPAFELTIDDLLKLKNEGIPAIVLKEIAPRRKDPAPPAAGAEAEFSADNRFRLRYPQGWHTQTRLIQNGMQYSFSPEPIVSEEEAAVLCIVVCVDFLKEAPPAAKLEESVTPVLENLTRSKEAKGSKVEILEKGEARLGDLPVIRWRVKMTNQEGRCEIGELAAGYTPRVLFLFSWSALEARCAAEEPALHGVFETFELGEAARAAAPPAASPVRPAPADIEKWSKDGVAADEIIRRIRESGATFDLATEEALALRKAGVDTAVVKEMKARPLVWLDAVEGDGAISYQYPEGWQRHDLREHTKEAVASAFLTPTSVQELGPDSTGIIFFILMAGDGKEVPSEEKLAQGAHLVLDQLVKSFQEEGESLEAGEGSAMSLGDIPGYRLQYRRAHGERRGSGFVFFGVRDGKMLFFTGQTAEGASPDRRIVEKVFSSLKIGGAK
ncbi:MAG: hypothetical protein HY720_31755 [Planctomycetes bacterium]|nr:hypothetical protein [Planctomycetota bacterium]